MLKLKSIFHSGLTLAIFCSMFNLSCDNQNDNLGCFPKSDIHVAIANINMPGYVDLQNKGWQYIHEQNSGTRGLIIFRKSTSEFTIYDRNAPHICPDTNTTLEVINGNKVVCPKDGAEWMLSSGAMIKVANRPLKTYRYQFNPSTGQLTIYN